MAGKTRPKLLIYLEILASNYHIVKTSFLWRNMALKYLQIANRPDNLPDRCSWVLRFRDNEGGTPSPQEPLCGIINMHTCDWAIGRSVREQ